MIHVNHKPISLKKENVKKSCANCYGGTDNFFQLIICVLVDAGFNTCNGWRISSSSHMFSKLLPVQPDPGYESQTYVL